MSHAITDLRCRATEQVTSGSCILVPGACIHVLKYVSTFEVAQHTLKRLQMSQVNLKTFWLFAPPLNVNLGLHGYVSINQKMADHMDHPSRLQNTQSSRCFPKYAP